MTTAILELEIAPTEENVDGVRITSEDLPHDRFYFNAECLECGTTIGIVYRANKLQAITTDCECEFSPDWIERYTVDAEKQYLSAHHPAEYFERYLTR